MEKIRLDITKALSFLDPGTLEAYAPQVAAAQTALEQGTCPGNDFLGWLHLPSSITPEFLNEVQAVADTLRSQCDYVVVAGIGGSYLGARAIIEAIVSRGWSATTATRSSSLLATTLARTTSTN